MNIGSNISATSANDLILSVGIASEWNKIDTNVAKIKVNPPIVSRGLNFTFNLLKIWFKSKSLFSSSSL